MDEPKKDGQRTVFERIQSHFDSLTSAEKRAARALTTDYPVTGMDTVQRFAERASVSPATIVRFVKSLGFDSFRDFQESLRAEVKERQESVLTQATSTQLYGVNASTTGTLERSKRVFLEGIESTLSSIRTGEYLRTVDWLADSKRRIVAAGGTFSRLLADHLVAQLSLFRGNVLVSPESALERASLVLESRAKRDVWVLFDFRRYQPGTEMLAREVNRRGARLVLVTDRWLSPIASIADVVLIASVDAPGPSDSLVPGLALVEALSEEVSLQIGEQGIAKLEQLDPVRVRLEFTGEPNY